MRDSSIAIEFPLPNEFVLNSFGHLVPKLNSNLVRTTSIGHQRTYPLNMALKLHKEQLKERQKKMHINEQVDILNQK